MKNNSDKTMFTKNNNSILKQLFEGCLFVFIFLAIPTVVQAQDKWTPDINNFDNYMTLTASLTKDDVSQSDETIEVGCFVDGKCRGISYLTTTALSQYPHLLFLPIWGSSTDDGKLITFKIFEHKTRTEYEADKKIVYQYNGTVGFGEPYKMNINSFYAITLQPEGDYTFPDLQEGYKEVQGQTITIVNKGKLPTDDLSVSLEGDNADSFQLSTQNINSLSIDGESTFSVTPHLGLTIGEYTATVSVSNENVLPTSFRVKLHVKEKSAVGIDDTFQDQDKIKAWILDNKLIVEGIPMGCLLKIYTIGGELVHENKINDKRSVFDLPHSGIYILHWEEGTEKNNILTIRN